MTKKRITTLLVLGLVLGLAFSGQAITPESLGLGGPQVALTGTAALDFNPAAVHLNPSKFTLELGGGAAGWNNLLSNSYLEESAKEKLLEKLASQAWVLRGKGQGAANLLVGPVGLLINGRGEGNISLTEDLGELILKGNEIGKNYSFEGSEGSAAFYADAGLNYSFQLPLARKEKVYLGFSYHYLQGYIVRLAGTGSSQLTYDAEGNPVFTGDGKIRIEYNEDELATGSSLDLGVYAEINDKLKLGLSVLNLGKLEADGGKYEEYVAAYDEDNNLVDSRKGELGEGLVWQLPRRILLGGNYQLNSQLDLYGSYTHTSYEQGLIDQQLALGTEFCWLKFMPLRLGVNYSTLRSDFDLTGGLGFYLGPVKLDLAVTDLLGLFNASKGIAGGLSLKIEL